MMGNRSINIKTILLVFTSCIALISPVSAQVDASFVGVWRSVDDPTCVREKGNLDGLSLITRNAYSFSLGEDSTVCQIRTFKKTQSGVADVGMACRDGGLTYRQRMYWKLDAISSQPLLTGVYFQVSNIQGRAHRMPSSEPVIELLVKCD